MDFKSGLVLMILACVKPSDGFNVTDGICDGVKEMTKVKNPLDCGSYFLCYTDSVPLLITCAGNHEFNEKTRFCDWPENAQCSLIQETTTLPATTTERPTYPNCDGDTVSWQPSPHSCSKFFLCFHGNAIERTCAPGENFDVNFKSN